MLLLDPMTNTAAALSVDSGILASGILTGVCHGYDLPVR